MSRNQDDDRPRGRGRDDDEPRRRGGRDDDERPRGGRSRDDDDDRGSRRRGSGYEYAARSSEQAKKRGEANGGDFDKFLLDSIKMYKVQDGPNSLRILPPTWKKPEHFGFDIWVHYGVGPDRQTYLCLHKMKGEKCPICEERTEAERNGDEKYAKELKPRQRVLMYVIDREHEKDGVQAWAAPWTLDRDLAKVSTDRRTGEVLAIDHPEEGYDIEFDKKGAKQNTEYIGIAVARRSSPLGSDKWLDFAVDHPLPDQLQYFDYDHIAKAFGGGGGGGGKASRDDDDDRGGRSRSPLVDQAEPRRQARREAEDDRPRGRGREESRADDDLTWAQIHEMTSSELDDLVEVRDLDINVKKFDSDEELADRICELLDISKKTERSRPRDDDDKPRRSRGDDDDDKPRRSRGDDDGDDDRERLARMRRERDDDDRPTRRTRGD